MKIWSLAIAMCFMTGAVEAPLAEENAWLDARRSMVQTQLVARGIQNEGVLNAMSVVPRHEFVPTDRRAFSYADGPLPVGWNQTISQPYIVALMTELLEIKEGQKVLEIGTGSGYQAAVLAQIKARVFSIEILPELAAWGKENIVRAGYRDVSLRVGDGYKGWPEQAPFDAIIVTCAPENIPAALTVQLKEGGRMIIPVGPQGGMQELVLVTKTDGRIEQRAVIPVRFVPMIGGK